MRTPDIVNYNNDTKIVRKKLGEVPTIDRYINIMSEKDKLKFIFTLERIVRSSMEYKQYIEFLRKEIDMVQCSFFKNIDNKEGKRVTIEIHHEPFTLFDITQAVVEKWMAEGTPINPLMMSDEIMRIHYQNKVGLIPVSITVHELIHVGKLFVPLQNVYGNFIAFLEEYDQYIPNDVKEKLQLKLQMSKDATNQDMSIIEKKYLYLEVDGFSLPQPLEEKVELR